MTTVIDIQNLWWRYPTFSETPNDWTLRDLSLQVQEGECLGITGPSGSGKSTLCRAILGIIPEYSRLTPEQLREHFRGTVTLSGQPASIKTLKQQSLGMVMQDPENQFLRMSLFHELALGLQLQQVPEEEIIVRSHEALSWVGLGHLWQGAAFRAPNDLSGGQKQRIAIAAFLAMRPRILILDEPTSDLDPVGKREIIEVLARLRKEYQLTVLLVEQDPEILSTFCDRIALIQDGQVKALETPARLYTQQALIEESGVSSSELVRLSWAMHQPLSLTLADSYRQMEPLISAYPFSTPARQMVQQDQLAFKATDVTFSYPDGSQALFGVDVEAARGEMVALLGQNGSGKTTFARILAGLAVASGGHLEVLGESLASRRVRKKLPTKVGYVFQNPDHQLFCRSVYDEVEYGLKNLDIPPRKRRELVTSTLEAVRLSTKAQEDPLFLSKGERQRLAVAAVLAMGPDILVVDEPTTGQDAHSIASMMELLSALRNEGKTILVITHDMSLAAEHCQRLVVFREGRVQFTGTPETFYTDEAFVTQTGLSIPLSAQLANQFRRNDPTFPRLISVADWVHALEKDPVRR